ncbi:hypothetical protein OAF27_01795 [Verrucomicrobiales bacterium]|nr:hypothetical protein [Verrucomicrobiales bacterium]
MNIEVQKVVTHSLVGAASLAVGFLIADSPSTPHTSLSDESQTTPHFRTIEAIPPKTENVISETRTGANHPENWKNSEPAGSLLYRAQSALSTANSYDRMRAFHEILDEMTPEDGPALVELIQESDRRGTGNGSEWAALWNRWGELDGRGAFEHLTTVDTSAWHRLAKPGAAYRALRGFAQSDPQAAVAFSKTETATSIRYDLHNGLIEGWSWEDPEAAFRYAAELERENIRSNAIPIAIKAITREGGPDGLESWFQSLGSSEEQEMAGRFVVDRMFADPTRGVEWLERSASEDWVTANVLNQAGNAIRKKSGSAEALDWINSFPGTDETVLQTSLQNTVRDLGLKEPGIVNSWLQGHQGLVSYDEIASNFIADSLAEYDAPSAAVLAMTIQNPEIRKQTLDKLADIAQ